MVITKLQQRLVRVILPPGAWGVGIEGQDEDEITGTKRKRRRRRRSNSSSSGEEREEEKKRSEQTRRKRRTRKMWKKMLIAETIRNDAETHVERKGERRAMLEETLRKETYLGERRCDANGEKRKDEEEEGNEEALNRQAAVCEHVRERRARRGA